MAPKATPAPAVKAAGKGAQGNILTKKIGPLPGWAWAAIGLGGLYLWKKHQASSAASTAATTATPAASLPTSDVTAPSGYGYQGPGVGSGGGAGPGWNVGPPTGSTGGGIGNGVQPGGVFQPAPGTTPNTGDTTSAIVSEDNAFTQQLANQTGVPQQGVVLGTSSGLPGGASFITNPAVNDPQYNAKTGI